MNCKYCGYKMVQGRYCFSSPTTICIGSSDGTNCVYCGHKFVQNGYCLTSPSKKHMLDT